MGTYHYIKEKKSESGFLPAYEDDYIQALFSISQKYGLKITNEMILSELQKRKGDKKAPYGKHTG